MLFEIETKDDQARAGVLYLPRGEAQTPVFMPVGTQASVKTLSVEELESMDADIILSNAYHLYLRPGIEVIKNAGGLHKFMNWKGNILTDSGGFQVFSLARLNSVTDEGVTFQSHIDGSRRFLTPEEVIRIQDALGSDIIMCLDECVKSSASIEEVEIALIRTTDWAKRSKEELLRLSNDRSVLFGIVQGGLFPELRERSAKELIEIGFPGYAIGGLSVGESKTDMVNALKIMNRELPFDKPRYLMGVGVPEDILNAIELGVDMFDCVFPTRAARHSTVFSHRGKLHLKNKEFEYDLNPISRECGCYTCRNYTLSYLRHLFITKEMLGMRLAALHNLHFLIELTKRARIAIINGEFQKFKSDFISGYSRL